jgi:ubiquinone/menaquinone biosynthesis C-methylase UbiE
MMTHDSKQSSWDRSAPKYVAQWGHRLLPYHRDLVDELLLEAGQSVLVVSAGPAAEALLAARRVGASGTVLATDASAEMVRVALDEVKRAKLANVQAQQGDLADTAGRSWDAVVCAFALWQVDDASRKAALMAWRDCLFPRGKVGVVTWGPREPDAPFERFAAILQQLEPGYLHPARRYLAARDHMTAMFESAGLSMVRHTVIRHPQTFARAEEFVASLRDASTIRAIWERLGDVRFERVAAAFYESVGGPDAPLTFAPAATLAIAARPGSEVYIAARPSVRAPPVK